jgi:hypothetical protein
MNKSLLVVLALGTALLTSCSSHPSDLRPGDKVSNDAIAPGTRETDYSNFGGNTGSVHGGHETHGKEHGREDVMLNHDEGANDISHETEQVPAEHKTTEADSVENHQ